MARILFGTALFVFSLTKAFHEWAEIPEFFHGFRARYFPLLGIPVLGTQALIALEWVWRGAILMSARSCSSAPTCPRMQPRCKSLCTGRCTISTA